MTEVLDPTFYRTAGEAASAPAEKLAYVVAFAREGPHPGAPPVGDVEPGSSASGRGGAGGRRVRPGGGLGGLTEPRGRVSPFRVERVQQRLDARGSRHVGP